MNEYMKVAIELSKDNLNTNNGGPFGACIVKDGEIRPVAGDDAREVCWASVQMMDGQLAVCINGDCINDELAFDHYDILSDAYRLAIK